MSENIIDQLNNRIGSFINKNDVTYQALIGKTPFTQNVPIVTSSDYNCGAIANELELLKAFIIYVISSFDFQNAETELLEIIIGSFTEFKRIYNETDADFRIRFQAYMQRNSNTRWMTIWSLIDLFSYFFDKDNIYYEENYVETNLVENFDFEVATGDDFDNWTESMSGTSTITKNTANSFTGNNAAKFIVDASGSNASITQTINSIVSGNYKFCFWYFDDGTCPVDDVVKITVRRSGDNYYWNFDDEVWQVGIAYKSFAKSSTWKYAWAWINNTGTYNLTISIMNNSTSAGTSHAFYIDRVQFGVWQNYPSVKLIIVFEGQSVQGNMSVFPGSWDNLIYRGECEDTTPPMILAETVPVLSNVTWARSGVRFFWGLYSYLFTVTTGGSISTVDLVDDNSTSNMHGLTANTEYTFMIRVYIPSSGITASEIKIQIQDYVASWETQEQAAATVYDEWQLIKVTKTIRNAATGVIIRIKTDATTSNGDLFYVDDVRLIEGESNNMEYATFYDQSYYAGEGSGYTTDFFEQLLATARVAGAKSTIQKVNRIIT